MHTPPSTTPATSTSPSPRPIRLAILGLGTVGGGLVQILHRRKTQLHSRAGGPLTIVGIAVRDLDKVRDLPVNPGLLTTNATELINRDDVDVVVELMGGLEPARSLVVAALRAGKTVVTANKAIVARYGDDLTAAAAAGGGQLFYEAAAAGAVPVVKVVRESLSGDRIERLLGIVNGTCNFILTRMSNGGASFASALSEAQALGYAEADPTSDVGGEDSAYKLCLLARLAFDADVQIAHISCEGIDTVRAQDIIRADALGYVIKLLAIAERRDAGLELRVHPTLVPKSHPLASVHDAFNAVFIEGDSAGPLMLYGQGAGRLPTASAVIADVVDAALALRSAAASRPAPVVGHGPAILSSADAVSRYYVATRVADEPGVLAAIAGALAARGVSVESCLQEGQRQDPVDLIFVTHSVRDGDLRAALDDIITLPAVRSIAAVMRVLT